MDLEVRNHDSLFYSVITGGKKSKGSHFSHNKIDESQKKMINTLVP